MARVSGPVRVMRVANPADSWTVPRVASDWNATPRRVVPSVVMRTSRPPICAVRIPRRAFTTWPMFASLRMASAPALVKIRSCSAFDSESKYACGLTVRSPATDSDDGMCRQSQPGCRAKPWFFRYHFPARTTHREQDGGFSIRMYPPTCSRCVVLAGKWYRKNQGFARHPGCDCRHIPSSESVAGDLTVSPQAYFDSLSKAEQDRIFTNAGAEAIRNDANIGQVVNARRGMRTAQIGGRDVLITTEGTTRRGVAYLSLIHIS